MVRRRRRAKLQSIIQSRVALVVAVAWILFAFLIVMTWHSAFLESLVPKWMIKAIYPIDKTDLDMLRFTHFLALALVVTRYLPRNWSAADLQMAASADPVRSAFAADFLLRRVPVLWRALDPDAVHAGRLGAAAVSAAGILIMVAAAWLLDRAAKVPNLFVDASEFGAAEGGDRTRESVIRVQSGCRRKLSSRRPS